MNQEFASKNLSEKYLSVEVFVAIMDLMKVYDTN